MFVADFEFSTAIDNANTTIYLESLEYLKDEDNTLESLNRYTNVGKPLLKYNTCLTSFAPMKRLFLLVIMRPHKRNLKVDLFEQILVSKSVKYVLRYFIWKTYCKIMYFAFI